MKYLNEIKPAVIHYDLKPGIYTLILTLKIPQWNQASCDTLRPETRYLYFNFNS